MAMNQIIHERITLWTILLTLTFICIGENPFYLIVDATPPTLSSSSSQRFQPQQRNAAISPRSSDTHVTKKPWVIGVNNLRYPSAPAASKAQTTHLKHFKDKKVSEIGNLSNVSNWLGETQDFQKGNGEKMPYDEIPDNSIDSSPMVESGNAYGMKVYKDIEALLKKLINSKADVNNNLDLDVITQAFRFVKLDSHLTSLTGQLQELQRSHENLQSQTIRQDTKFDLILDEIKSLVNSAGESVKVKGAEAERIETEMKKMNSRLDQALEKIIKSSATSHIMFDLSKEGLLQMDQVEGIAKEVLKEVKAVNQELEDVGQVSIQAITYIQKLEENLMAGLAEIGNRTIYAMRQEAQIIGPTVLPENGNEGSSIQADGSNPGGFPSSVKKVAILVGDGGITKAESLVSCLSRKRLINEKRPRDCGDIQLLGYSQNGVYTIFPTINSDQPKPTEVYCDLKDGWTVIMKRTDDQALRENFYRPWEDYKNGFGSAYNQYWIGLDNIAAITEAGDQELKVILTDWNGGVREANYAYFRVANSSDKFRLHLTDFSGNAGDSFAYHNGMAFSTKDQDNDLEKSFNCAQKYEGAWWYKSCHQSNLNGIYMDNNRKGKHESYGLGIIWYSAYGYYYSIRRVEMKIRTRNFLHLK